jgi:NADPH:quinone reductase-like Zn-dependent oxidoreductase/acyl carrier protein
MAAVRIAQRVGARVFATAGSPKKIAALRAMGVEHVMSSRSLAFADEIERLTGGRGVDMVLNSLAGEFIPKSLSILAPCGRFLEIGRRDIAQNSPLGMGWLKKSVAVIGVDLFEALFGASRALGESLIEELSRELQDGGVEPLPRTVFSMGDAEAAFRYMAEAKHIGKVVLSLRPEERAAIAPPRDASVLDPEGTYLIVGGLGGLGLETAKWLVQRGAQSLVLVGRSGASDAANEAILCLRSAGADVLVERADMAREDDARRVIEGVARRGRPLRGVIHAAVQMADATILRATREQIRKVMASKVDIAWNLHAATRGAPLDMFVLFSSAAALLGSPGQAVYAAANAFLDALARKRRAEGLPALSVGFGTWAEAGGATGEDKAGRLALRGLEGLSTEEGLAALERLLGSGEAHAGVMRLDLRRWRQSYPQIADWPLLSELDAQSAAEGAASKESSARAAILEAPGPAARRAALEAHLRREIGRVLRLSPDSIGATTSFGTLGFDSLMALELRNRLEASLGCRLAATLVWAHPTLTALVDHIAQKLGVSVEAEVTPPPAPLGPPAPPPPVDAPPVAVEALSDEQADALMAEKLAALERRFWG